MISIGERGFRRRCSSIRMCFLRVWVLSIWTRLRDHRSLSIIHIDEFSTFLSPFEFDYFQVVDSSRHLAVKVGDLGRLLRATILRWFCKPSVNDCIFRYRSTISLWLVDKEMRKMVEATTRTMKKKRKKHGKGRNAEGKGVWLKTIKCQSVDWLLPHACRIKKNTYSICTLVRQRESER